MYWTPSKMISLLGERVNNESSVLYWCWKNKIPVYCPALTDGAVGDNIFFFNTKHEQKIRLDFVEGDILLIIYITNTNRLICLSYLI